MPLDTCITNVGEYYSSHYLDSTFSKDVKELVSRWNEQGSSSIPRRLRTSLFTPQWLELHHQFPCAVLHNA